MEVYCVFKYGYDNPDLQNIFLTVERAQDWVDFLNDRDQTEDYSFVVWEVN